MICEVRIASSILRLGAVLFQLLWSLYTLRSAGFPASTVPLNRQLSNIAIQHLGIVHCRWHVELSNLPSDDTLVTYLASTKGWPLLPTGPQALFVFIGQTIKQRYPADICACMPAHVRNSTCCIWCRCHVASTAEGAQQHLFASKVPVYLDTPTPQMLYSFRHQIIYLWNWPAVSLSMWSCLDVPKAQHLVLFQLASAQAKSELHVTAIPWLQRLNHIGFVTWPFNIPLNRYGWADMVWCDCNLSWAECDINLL